MHTVVFGDSIAKGVVTTQGKIETIEDNAVTLISNYYHQKIDNISFYGQTLKRIYEKKLIDQYLETIGQGDELLAVFALGGNDSDYDWKKVSENPKVSHESKTLLQDFEHMLIEMIEKLKDFGAKIVLTTIIPLDSQSYFDQVISKRGNPEQIMIFLENDVENIYRHQEAYSKAIQKCALITNTSLLDVRRTMTMINKTDKFMCDDGVHPNADGYKYIADSIIKEINQYGLLEKWRKSFKLYQKPGDSLDL